MAAPPPDPGDAFQLPSGLHYLNCAYMSPLPRSVEAAGIRGIRRKRVPSRIGSEDFFQECDALRTRFARLVGSGESDRVALLPAVSYGVAVVAKNAGSLQGRNVVVVRDQFPGNVYAWMEAARSDGGELRIVDSPGPSAGHPGRGAGWTQRVLEAVDQDTAVVAMAPVHWTDGTRFDLEAVGHRCREVGALFVVDGTQWVGAAPFSVDRVRPDALICAGYKWLLGPYSLAAGYFGARFDQGIPLEAGWITRAGSRDFASLVNYTDEYAPGAVRYDVGERSNFILVPMLLEALRLVEAWSPERVERHCRGLTDLMARPLAERGFGVEEREWRAPHILGLTLPPEMDGNETRRTLEARRVQVSLRGSAVRVSPYLYNEPSDVEALVEGLMEALEGR